MTVAATMPTGSSTFSANTFRPRLALRRQHRIGVSFSPAVSNKGLKALSEARFAAGTFRDAVSLVAFLFLVQRGSRPHLHRRREPSFDIHQHPRAVRMSLHRSYQQSVFDAVEGTLGTLPTATSRITPSGCGLFDPLESQVLEVLGWSRPRGELDVLVVLPDGSRSWMPASWTDLRTPSPRAPSAARRCGRSRGSSSLSRPVAPHPCDC